MNTAIQQRNAKVETFRQTGPTNLHTLTTEETFQREEDEHEKTMPPMPDIPAGTLSRLLINPTLDIKRRRGEQPT